MPIETTIHHRELTKKLTCAWTKTKRDQTIDNRSEPANQYEKSVGNETWSGKGVSLSHFDTICLRSRVYQITKYQKCTK